MARSFVGVNKHLISARAPTRSSIKPLTIAISGCLLRSFVPEYVDKEREAGYLLSYFTIASNCGVERLVDYRWRLNVL